MTTYIWSYDDRVSLIRMESGSALKMSQPSTSTDRPVEDDMNPLWSQPQTSGSLISVTKLALFALCSIVFITFWTNWNTLLEFKFSSRVEQVYSAISSTSQSITGFSDLSNLKSDNYGLQEGVKSVHRYRDDGVLEVNMDGPHPILELIGNAQKAWEEKLGKASKTLDEAVDEYVRRYGRMPPRHFDVWLVLL